MTDWSILGWLFVKNTWSLLYVTDYTSFDACNWDCMWFFIEKARLWNMRWSMLNAVSFSLCPDRISQTCLECEVIMGTCFILASGWTWCRADCYDLKLSLYWWLNGICWTLYLLCVVLWQNRMLYSHQMCPVMWSLGLAPFFL